MNRFTGTFLLLGLLATPSLEADTFASQLRTAKHIGLAVDSELRAFTVHVYSPEQFREHSDSRTAFRNERDALTERLEGYDRERQDARTRGATTAELSAITAKIKRDVTKQPKSSFDKRIKLHTVVSWGDDYILLLPFDKPRQRILIPLNRIGRVIRATKKTETSSSSS